MIFYGLRSCSADDKATDFIEAARSELLPAPTCSACGRWTDNLRFTPSLTGVVETWWKGFSDMCWGCPKSGLIISESMVNWLLAIPTTDIEIVGEVGVRRVVRKGGRFKALPPRYFCCFFPANGARIDWAATGFPDAESTVCPVCLLDGKIRDVKDIVFQKGSWNGKDFVRPTGRTGEFLVSQRLKDALEASDFCGFRFTNVAILPE